MISYIIEGTCRRLSQVPEGAQITYVNGREVLGKCEGCMRLLYSDSGAVVCDEGVILCKRCGKEAIASMERKP